LTFGVVNLFQIGVVGDGLDSFLRRDDLVIAGHHDHGAELQALSEVHGADGGAAG
jgi:hypothetical protein